MLFPAWNKLDNDLRPWAQLPLQILPNILGFSMGGMAITLAFTGSSLFRVIAQYGKENSYFIKMIAAFYHFIIVQTLAILFGLICQVYTNVIASGVGFFLMIYAIMVAVATATQLFNTARIANVASRFTDAQLDAANTTSTDAKPDETTQRSSP